MKTIYNKGNPGAPCWIVVERPYPKDAEKGYVFSSGMGYVWDKMMSSAGLRDYYVACRAPDLEDKYSFSIIENELNHYRPPIIIPLGDSGKHFCPELAAKPKKGEEEKTELDKYAGSLLKSKLLNYDHFIIPTYTPEKIVQDWSLRDIVTSLDLGKAKSELDYFRSHGTLEPLPKRELKFDLSFDETIAYLDYFKTRNLLSIDIESIYTNMKSAFYPHPGYPISIGIADSPNLGVSFNLWWDDPEKNIKLWRELDKVFSQSRHLGQNYFNFDFPRLASLGFTIDDSKIVDTLIRHHVLWPELKHSLAFQTRQYTREPYYKDDGKRWKASELQSLKRYNCLDVCITFEIYLKQEEEFNERPYLR